MAAQVKDAEQKLEKITIADEETDEICEECGRRMVIKYGPHGKFLACPGFPECKNTKPYLEKIGVPCPKCGKDVLLKKTKKGRRYFGCIDNPECDFMSWQKPSTEKCPQCGGVMDYDPATGTLKCPYCDYEQEIKREEQKPEKAAEMDFYAAEHTANKDWGVDTKTVICKACGAESIYDALQTSAVCPFCGSNQVMDAQAEDTIAPGGVVPFSVDDKKASENFNGWIKRKWFCPKLAKQSAKPDRFKGIYLPYWTFDTNTYSSYTGEYGIDHTTKDEEGNTQVR